MFCDYNKHAFYVNRCCSNKNQNHFKIKHKAPKLYYPSTPNKNTIHVKKNTKKRFSISISMLNSIMKAFIN